jgi:hypothetical protein
MSGGKAPAARQFTTRDGRELALQMLHELEAQEAGDCSPCAIEPEERGGEPQLNLVLKYLDAIAAHRSRALVVGFSEILTGYISCCAADSVPNADYFEPYLDAKA